MKIALLSSVLALGLLSGACSDDDDDKNPADQIPNQLAGLYKTDCSQNGVLGLTSTAREIDLTAIGGFDRKEMYYGGDACTDAVALTYRVTGTVQSQGALPENTQLDLINFSVSEAYITPGTDALVTTLNTTKFCGKSDWAIGQEVTIGGLDCNGFTIRKGDVIPEVYEDVDGTLYFGKKFALLLNQTGERPTEVDMDLPYHKQ
ncbi:MAG: hypothetical protein EOP04_12690 [Proteobacteria bacterium]|nr:MAG: hypothetical protein EOP04_12690 [Pseudomonadota bacterium]